MARLVRYRGVEFWLTDFYGRPGLRLRHPEQRKIPKLEFVGGYPDEWYIFLDNLTEAERAKITPIDFSPEGKPRKKRFSLFRKERS